MAKELLDIVDTAVKIGLGALISGVSTFYVTKLNHKTDVEKESARRRRELLEKIAGEVEIFSNATLEYWAYLVEFTRYKGSPKTIPDGLKEKVEEAGDRLFRDFAHLTSAESKLLLLGHEACELAVKEFGEYVKAMRRKAWKEDSSLTSKEVESFRIKDKRKTKETLF